MPLPIPPKRESLFRWRAKMYWLLKQRNRNNAAIENPPIKPSFSALLLPSPIRRSDTINATASRRAVHHAIQIVKREADAVIGHAVLRKVVSANFFFASAGSDLAAALRAVFLRF